jgi:hypothetical protein
MVQRGLNSELKKLRSNLPKGYRNKLAEEYSVSPEFVDMVLRGAREGIDIIESAVKMAKEHKQKMIDLTEEIKAI